MNPLRRHLLRAGGAGTTLVALAAAGLLHPLRVLAAEWHRPAFTATALGDALRHHGSAVSQESRDIVIQAADIAENGANVPIEISSQLPGSQTIAVFAEKNPMPLAASISFGANVLPQVRLSLKLADSTRIRVAVRTADGKTYHATREIKVTIGGCGG